MQLLYIWLDSRDILVETGKKRRAQASTFFQVNKRHIKLLRNFFRDLIIKEFKEHPILCVYSHTSMDENSYNYIDFYICKISQGYIY